MFISCKVIYKILFYWAKKREWKNEFKCKMTLKREEKEWRNGFCSCLAIRTKVHLINKANHCIGTSWALGGKPLWLPQLRKQTIQTSGALEANHSDLRSIGGKPLRLSKASSPCKPLNLLCLLVLCSLNQLWSTYSSINVQKKLNVRVKYCKTGK